MAMKLYVGRLAYATTDDELKDAFAAHGEVVSASVVKDKFSGQSRGFGFVEMAKDEEAQAAIKALDGTELGGRNIAVSEARPPEERPNRNGGSGGFRGNDRGGNFNRN